MSEPLERAMNAASAALGDRGLAIVAGLIILFVGWVVARLASRAAAKAGKRSPVIDDTLAPLLAKIVRMAVMSVALLMALDKFGFDTTSLIAFVGAMGVAIGLALKDTVGDLASGIVLLVLRPFGVGDVVNVDGNLGKVEAIDLFETKLRSLDGVPMVLPNSKVRGNVINNYSRANQRRTDLVIGIAYEADISTAIKTITATLRADARVLKDPDILVNVQELNASSVDLLVRYWTQPDDFFVGKLDITRDIKLALDAADIEIPYPKRSITVVNTSATG